MQIAIVTCDLKGLASHHLSKIINQPKVEVVAVIFTKGEVVNKKRFYANKIKKAWKIGLGGVINGYRMRSWYRDSLQAYLEIPELESFCKTHNLPFYQVNSLNSEKAVQIIKESKAELGISLGNGYISPKFFSVPKYGMINIHHEQLPDYQNAQSVIWQIYNQSKNTGYTIHKISSKIDAGDIVLQKNVPILFKSTLQETVSATYAQLFEASADGLLEVLNEPLEYLSNATIQEKGNSYTTPSLIQIFKIYRNHKLLKKG